MKNNLLLFILCLLCINVNAQQFTQVQGNLTFIANYFGVHDSNSCSTDVTISLGFSKNNSFVGDSVNYYDGMGQIAYSAINTSGSNPFNGTLPAVYDIHTQVTDDFIINNLLTNIMFLGNKLKSETDSFYNNFFVIYTIPITNPCGYDSISGKVYIDNNNDCIYNTGDINLNSIGVQATGTFSSSVSNSNFYRITNSTGDYYLPVLKSWFQNYNVSLSNNYSLLFPTSTCGFNVYTVTNLPANNIDFALNCSGNIDLQAKAVSSLIRPLVPAVLHLSVSNIGCDSASGMLTLIKPSLLTYNPALSSNLPNYVNGDTMKWNYANLSNISNGAYWNSFMSALYFTPDSNLNIGDTVCFQWFTTIASNDIDSTNNSGSICLPVVNSYDPNDKQSFPKGDGIAGNIAPDTKEMNYTIRFQNTGNAQAYNVTIADTLDSDFDIRSLIITSNSHICTPDVKGNIINFNFYNINLPDSNTNEPLSHGSVSYKINVKPNLPLGTLLKNTAHIYFDNNPAIVTNSTLNTLALPTTLNDLKLNSNLNLFPNPAQNYFVLNNILSSETMYVKVINNVGKVVYNNRVKSMEKIDIEPFASGFYIVEIVSSTGINRVKLLKN